MFYTVKGYNLLKTNSINPVSLSYIIVFKMADIEVSGECSSHISEKSKGNNDMTICKKCSE